jgi:hypothetical protein
MIDNLIGENLKILEHQQICYHGINDKNSCCL